MNYQNILFHVAAILMALSVIAWIKGQPMSFVTLQICALWTHLFRLSLR